MTTSVLSAVLPSVDRTSRSANTDSSSSSDSGFSAVLSGQAARHQINSTSSQTKPASQNSANASGEQQASPDSTSDIASDTAASSPSGEATATAPHGQPAADNAWNDANTALQAAENGLALPQIALNLAAEVAAVRAGGTIQAADTRSLGNDITRARLQGLMGGKAAASLSGQPDAKQTTDARNGAASVSLGVQNSGLISPALIHSSLQPLAQQTHINPQPGSTVTARLAGDQAGGGVLTGRAISQAAMKQAVLTAQERMQAALNGTAPAQAPDFFSALANAQGVAADPVASDTLQQAQLFANALSSGTSAQQSPVPGLAVFNTSPASISTGAMAVPISSPQWGAELGRQFVSIVQGGLNTPHTAELRLDPPDLGPLRISISLSDNTAQASFVSPHAVVRQTVENALPQLQQALAQAGISLGQTSVSDQGQSEQAFNQESGGSKQNAQAAGGNNQGMTGSAQQGVALRAVNPNALVDTFA